MQNTGDGHDRHRLSRNGAWLFGGSNPVFCIVYIRYPAQHMKTGGEHVFSIKAF